MLCIVSDGETPYIPRPYSPSPKSYIHIYIYMYTCIYRYIYIQNRPFLDKAQKPTFLSPKQSILLKMLCFWFWLYLSSVQAKTSLFFQDTNCSFSSCNTQRTFTRTHPAMYPEISTKIGAPFLKATRTYASSKFFGICSRLEGFPKQRRTQGGYSTLDSTYIDIYICILAYAYVYITPISCEGMEPTWERLG